MKTTDINNQRLIAVRMLNEKFKYEPKVNMLEDTQVPNVIDAMIEYSTQQTATLHEQLKEAKEKMFDFVEWSGNKYQKFHDKWTLHCVDVYKTTNTFYTTEELFELYIQEKIKSTNS